MKGFIKPGAGRGMTCCFAGNIGALIIRIGLGVNYTIILIRNPPPPKPYSNYEGPYITRVFCCDHSIVGIEKRITGLPEATS